jgi:hypothetical protein
MGATDEMPHITDVANILYRKTKGNMSKIIWSTLVVPI